MIHMLVYVADDQSVSLPSASLPTLVVVFERRLNEGIALYFEISQGRSGIRLQYFFGTICRAVVIDKELIRYAAIVPEEVRQHFFFIPAQSMYVDPFSHK